MAVEEKFIPNETRLYEASGVTKIETIYSPEDEGNVLLADDGINLLADDDINILYE